MSEHERPEVECDRCDGEGYAEIIGGYERPCDACHGEGYRPATDDEWNDMAEAAWERAQEGEPPMSLDEQHMLAWEEKRRLTR